MTQQTMYPAQVGSPSSFLTVAISSTDTVFHLDTVTGIPTGQVGILTLGPDTQYPEVIHHASYDAVTKTITVDQRGFEGTAREWPIGTVIGRFITAYDQNSLQANVTDTLNLVTAAAPLASPTFTGTPAVPTAAVDTSTTQIASTAFVLAQLANGIALGDGKVIRIVSALGTDHTVSGITVTLTAAAAVTIGQVCYIDSSGQAALADGDAIATMPVRVMATGSIGAGSSGQFLILGYMRDDSNTYTVGGTIYASGTAGAVTQTAPSGTAAVVQSLGYAVAAHIMFFNPGTYLELV